MARSAARLKMGYYPLPPTEAQNIRSLLAFSGSCSVIDPCAGKGTALKLITAGAPGVGDCADLVCRQPDRERSTQMESVAPVSSETADDGL